MDQTKTKKVTFSTGLPRGACATFTHEGQRWFAYPAPKIQALSVVTDRMVGTIDRLHKGLVEWLNRHPEDAAWIVILMRSVASTRELALAKAEAWTWATPNTTGRTGAQHEDSTPNAEEDAGTDT